MNRQGDFDNPVVLSIICLGLIALVVLIASKFRGGGEG